MSEGEALTEAQGQGPGHRGCRYGLNVCVPLKVHMLNPNPKMMVGGGGVFGR